MDFLRRPVRTEPMIGPIASARLTVLASTARKTKSLPARSRTRTSLPASASRRKLGNLRVNSRMVACMTDKSVSHSPKSTGNTRAALGLPPQPELASPSAELVRNAARHGLSGAAGAIWVVVEEAADRITCLVCDDGAGAPGVRAGRGRRLVQALAAELGGSVEWTFAPAGCCVRLEFPRAEPAWSIRGPGHRTRLAFLGAGIGPPVRLAPTRESSP